MEEKENHSYTESQSWSFTGGWDILLRGGKRPTEKEVKEEKERFTHHVHLPLVESTEVIRSTPHFYLWRWERTSQSLSEGFSDGVTVSFMCQLGSATVPEYLVKHFWMFL